MLSLYEDEKRFIPCEDEIFFIFFFRGWIQQMILRGWKQNIFFFEDKMCLNIFEDKIIFEHEKVFARINFFEDQTGLNFSRMKIFEHEKFFEDERIFQGWNYFRGWNCFRGWKFSSIKNFSRMKNIFEDKILFRRFNFSLLSSIKSFSRMKFFTDKIFKDNKVIAKMKFIFFEDGLH